MSSIYGPAVAKQAGAMERSCSVVAHALSSGRCKRVRLVTGEGRAFRMTAHGVELQVPYPAVTADFTRRTWTAGVALQCAPSKARIARYPLRALTPRQGSALSWVEGRVALGWVSARWPGLVGEIQRLLPGITCLDENLNGDAIIELAMDLARSEQLVRVHPILGQLPLGLAPEGGLWALLKRAQGRMPWSINKRHVSPGYESIPVGGESHIKTSRLPPPSRPEEDDPEIRADRRVGIPYPEWNMWTGRFLIDHVAVLEQRAKQTHRSAKAVSPELRRWFEQRTHRVMKRRLEDGSDVDIDQYIEHYVGHLAGDQSDGRIFRDLRPAFRDVTTALLLDGSASLGIGGGDVFRLELGCADGLCHAMALSGERHGLFVFSGKTRHRVHVTCLRDFQDNHAVIPGDLGITTGGYTRLGAPLRHLTSRLLEQPTERRLLIVIGDGLISDEGYEGRYAWADSAHAVEEAQEAGVSLFYIGVGLPKVDPLPHVFGHKRFARIKHIRELPRVLARVHGLLVAA